MESFVQQWMAAPVSNEVFLDGLLNHKIEAI